MGGQWDGEVIILLISLKYRCKFDMGRVNKWWRSTISEKKNVTLQRNNL